MLPACTSSAGRSALDTTPHNTTRLHCTGTSCFQSHPLSLFITEMPAGAVPSTILLHLHERQLTRCTRPGEQHARHAVLAAGPFNRATGAHSAGHGGGAPPTPAATRRRREIACERQQMHRTTAPPTGARGRDLLLRMGGWSGLDGEVSVMQQVSGLRCCATTTSLLPRPHLSDAHRTTRSPPPPLPALYPSLTQPLARKNPVTTSTHVLAACVRSCHSSGRVSLSP